MGYRGLKRRDLDPESEANQSVDAAISEILFFCTVHVREMIGMDASPYIFILLLFYQILAVCVRVGRVWVRLFPVLCLLNLRVIG